MRVVLKAQHFVTKLNGDPTKHFFKVNPRQEAHPTALKEH